MNKQECKRQSRQSCCSHAGWPRWQAHGKAQTRQRAIFYEYGRHDSYLKPGRESDQSPTLALRDGDWKFLCNTDDPKAELYDLRRDPHETHNLINTQPKRAAAMKQRLLAWHAALPDVKPTIDRR